MKKKIIALFAFFVLVVMAMYAATGSVYVTSTGKKYHRRDCRTLARSKNATVTELTVEQAKAKGYEACKVCNP